MSITACRPSYLLTDAEGKEAGEAVWKIYEVSPVGLTAWYDYIPVGTLDNPANTHGQYGVDAYDGYGHISAYYLNDVTGLQAWVDYTPVVTVADAADYAWWCNEPGFIPVYDITTPQ